MSHWYWFLSGLLIGAALGAILMAFALWIGNGGAIFWED
jgi:hypothetical protein